MATQIQLRKTAKQYEIDERRKQVSLMIIKGMREVAIAEKLGVDNSTISKDIKALKLISSQFIYDITKSDFNYYYNQCLELVRHVLQKQLEIIDKEVITSQDMIRSRILSETLQTVSVLRDYYDGATRIYRDPMQEISYSERMGVRPGTKPCKPLTPEEEEEMFREEEEEQKRMEEEEEELDEQAEIKAEEEELRQKMRMVERNAAKVKRLQEQARRLEEHKRKFTFGGSISP